MDEMNLKKASSIVSTFIVWGEKEEGFDEALEMVNEVADNYDAIIKDAFKKGQMSVEYQLVRGEYYELTDKVLRLTNCHEITLKEYGGDEVTYEPVTKGHWEPCEPDYDREGTKILRRGANCSECLGFTPYPDRYCPHCGSWNKGHERGD